MLDEPGRLRCAIATIDEVGVLASAARTYSPATTAPRTTRGCGSIAATAERWFNTGDLGAQDARRLLLAHRAARRNSSFAAGTTSIRPRSRSRCTATPASQVAAAVGRPDAHAGEVRWPTSSCAGCRDQRGRAARVRDRSIGERAAVPKAVHIVAQIPVTGVGKIFKPGLKLPAKSRTWYAGKPRPPASRSKPST